jgi:predicted molibdopterin-dependent oxidoreductase YjgC
MGTREAGFTSFLPGYRKFDNSQDREALAHIWNVPSTASPLPRGLAYPDIIEAAVQGKIKSLWFIATNPAVSFPNYKLLEQALRSIEFLVVQDGFHPTPTSDFPHLVLPAAIWVKRRHLHQL